MTEHSIKNIADPEARIMRAKLKAQAAAGVIKKTGCPHPVSALQQYIDDTGYVHREGKPINLLVCTICKTELRIVGYDGVEAMDG